MGTDQPLPLNKKDMSTARIEVQQTHIHLGEDFVVTSLPDESYNCVAWAACDTEKNWWPFGEWWPPNVKRQTTLDCFVEVFEGLKYQICGNGELESGFEKVAIYTRDGRPTHMARQLPSGKWTSKSGTLYDIALADLDGLSGGRIGRVTRFMRRRVGN
jgi:hypothetical protein